MTTTIQPPSTETAMLAREILIKLGTDQAMPVGNANTGETTALPAHIADLIRDVLTGLSAGQPVTIAAVSSVR